MSGQINLFDCHPLFEDVQLGDVAVRRVVASRRARGVRVALGTARANDQRMAGRRLAGVATPDPDRLAVDAARSCSGPPGRRASGNVSFSRGPGTAAGTAMRG